MAAGMLAGLVWCGMGAERAWASTQTYDTTGSYSFTVPQDVTSIAVTAIGGAGGDCGVSPIAISRLDVSPHTVSIAGWKVDGKCVKPDAKNTAGQLCERPFKLTVGYKLSRAGTVTFTVKRGSTGRKVNGKCVAPTIKNNHDPRCTRLVNVRGNLVKTGKAGANRFVWNGKISGRQLAPGSYELTATLADGASQTATFTIVG
jgi:hypothetical protein